MNNNPPNPSVTEEMTAKRIELWFFRDLSDDQRLRLFRHFDFPVHEMEQTEIQRKALRHLLAMRAADQPPPNTDLTNVERLYPAALKRLAEQTELIVELETKLAAMQQPACADEVEQDLAIIDRLIRAAVGLGHGTDWNNGTHAIKHGYRKQLLDALIPALEAMARLQDRAALRSGVEALKHDLDRYMKIANIECNRAEKLQEALGVSLAALESVMRDEYDAFYTKVREAADIARTALDTEKERGDV